MLYRICDQLVILVRFRHLNGNLKLAGSGDGVDLWGVSWWHTTLDVSGRWGWFTGTCHGGARLDRSDRIDLWGRAMGHTSLAGSGRWDWIMGICDTGWIDGIVSWGYATLAGAGQWGWFMAVCDTGWNGVMGLIQGSLPWGHTTLAGSGWWIDLWGCAVGLGMQHGLDRGDRIDLWDTSWGDTTGLGRWDWF